MTFEQKMELLKTLFGLLPDIGTFAVVLIAAWKGRAVGKSVITKVGEIAQNVEKVHIATNSMHEEIVKITGESEKAKGVIEGRAGAMAEVAAKEK